MNILDASKLARGGLIAQRTRLNVSAANIANAQVTKSLDGGPYRAKNVVLRAIPLKQKSPLQTVIVSSIKDDPTPFREVYDPGHPDADERGIVRYPNVDVITEMVELLSASRAYEANLNVLSVTKSMFLKTLELIK